MPEQFENPEVIKLEDETVSDAAAQKRIERVASDDDAERASRRAVNLDDAGLASAIAQVREPVAPIPWPVLDQSGCDCVDDGTYS